MGYYYSSANGTTTQGEIQLPFHIGTSYSAITSYDQFNLRSTPDPFLLILIAYVPDSKVPYHITHISPNYYNYCQFSEQEFILFVRDREHHQHNTYELVYVQDGEFYQCIESQRHKYSAGSCFLLNKNTRHREEYITGFTTVSLSLSTEFFHELISEQDEKYFATRHLWNQNTELNNFFNTELAGLESSQKSYIDFIPKNQDSMVLHDLFCKLIDIVLSPQPGCSFTFCGLVCQIFLHLSKKEYFTTAPINLGTDSESRLFAQINNIIEKSKGRVSRDMLSKELCYSGAHLNRIVQKYTGMNITQYTTAFSIKHAAWMLIHTDLTISEIVAEHGFTDRTYFYNAFKKFYGETPRQYRSRNKQYNDA